MKEFIGRFVIEEEVGRGGMGVVYRALDKRLGRTIALKVLSAADTPDSDDWNRLRHEALAAAGLSHPSIAAVYDYVEEGGISFIAYEFVEGKTLDRLIAEQALSDDRIVDIALQVSAGLAFAHARGILHRDIKPQNLMVTPEGWVKIMDFGLSKRTDATLLRRDGSVEGAVPVSTVAGTIVGTVQYMSPEQITGEKLDGRSDLFSLGIVLYEMAAGENPFQGETPISTIGRILALDPVPISKRRSKVSPGLEEIIRRCLRKEREARYQSAENLRGDLETLRAAYRSGKAGERIGRGGSSLISRPAARLFMALLQILYLALYGLALYHHAHVFQSIAEGLSPIYGEHNLDRFQYARVWASVFLVSGCCGIAVRLFLLASVGFDDPESGRQFRRLFPYLLIVDEIWALSPLLLVGTWPAGFALVAVAMLAYLPITHLNLMRAGYGLN